MNSEFTFISSSPKLSAGSPIPSTPTSEAERSPAEDAVVV